MVFLEVCRPPIRMSAGHVVSECDSDWLGGVSRQNFEIVEDFGAGCGSSDVFIFGWKIIGSDLTNFYADKKIQISFKSDEFLQNILRDF